MSTQDFQISMFSWPYKIALVEDFRDPRTSGLRVGGTLTMTDVDVRDVRPDGTPAQKEDYIGKWNIEGVACAGRFALIRRPDAASANERSERPLSLNERSERPLSLADDFEKLIIQVSAQINDAIAHPLNNDDDPDVSAEGVFALATWVAKHGGAIMRALQRDAAIESGEANLIVPADKIEPAP